MQAAIAQQREVEAAVEKAREQHADRSEALNGVQGRFYRVGAEIARLEQAIQHARELRQRQQGDLSSVISGIDELTGSIERDEAQIDELDATLAQLGPGLETARAAEMAAVERLGSAERDMQRWQQRWEAFNTAAAEASRITEVERARIEQIETQAARLRERGERCAREQSRLTEQMDAGRLTALEAAEGEAAAAARELEAASVRVRQSIDALRQRESESAARVESARSELQDARSELASLEALQEAALGRSGGAVSDWLEGRGLEKQPRLAEHLNVSDGWERAAETVLGGYLEAVCVNGLDDVAGALDSLTHGAVSFLDTGHVAENEPSPSDFLRHYVSGPQVVGSLIGGVRVVEDLTRALAVRRVLGPGESVVTRAGIWMGPGWLRISRPSDGHSGLIQREHQIREQRERVEVCVAGLEQRESLHQKVLAGLRELDQKRDELQGQINEAHRELGDVRGRLGTARAGLDQVRTQLAQLETEGGEIEAQLGESDGALRASRERLDESLGQISIFEAQRQELEAQRDTLREALDAARQQAQTERAAAHDIAIKVESRRTSRQSAGVALERLRAQLEQFTRRRDELHEQLESGLAPLESQQGELAGLLEQRVGIESSLSEARDAVQAAEDHLRALQEQRQVRQRHAEEMRAALDELRLAAREISVRRQTLAEQFEGTGFDLAELRRELDTEASIAGWEEVLEKLRARVARLGPINLASIDELREQSERKEYLDSQYADLTEALTTLETAIRRIDRETRTRFKETYDQVNAGLKEIFPRLFGGGHGYLELSGDDLLDAGVTVMARPPGKRISSIHLLSGGEKALTAVALIFAIFALNPAPFCMLDEVDAPLDDANVSRFCDIVRDMSDRVQFIIITHNKTTMEMTHQLAGVTMHEPGVSRLVAVDLDEAVQMAAM
jgi:chromosome segregation protein